MVPAPAVCSENSAGWFVGIADEENAVVHNLEVTPMSIKDHIICPIFQQGIGTLNFFFKSYPDEVC